MRDILTGYPVQPVEGFVYVYKDGAFRYLLDHKGLPYTQESYRRAMEKRNDVIKELLVRLCDNSSPLVRRALRMSERDD